MFQIIAITRRKIRVSRIIWCANELVLVLVHVNWVGVCANSSRDPQRDKLHAYLCNIWCARHLITSTTSAQDLQRDKLHAYLCNIWCARHLITSTTSAQDLQRDKLHAYLCNIWCANALAIANSNLGMPYSQELQLLQIKTPFYTCFRPI